MLPRRFEGILNGTSVTVSEISDNHHVLDVAGRDAEGPGKLPHYRVAVIETGADNHVHVVRLPRDQPAVVAPLCQFAVVALPPIRGQVAPAVWPAAVGVGDTIGVRRLAGGCRVSVIWPLSGAKGTCVVSRRG
jgi:hypothetical protein